MIFSHLDFFVRMRLAAESDEADRHAILYRPLRKLN